MSVDADGMWDYGAAVITELARRGLTLARVDTSDVLPVIRVPSGTAPITPETVRRVLDEG
jgi:hypothetical protein